MKYVYAPLAFVLWLLGVALQKTFWWIIGCFVFPPLAWIMAVKWLIARYLS